MTQHTISLSSLRRVAQGNWTRPVRESAQSLYVRCVHSVENASLVHFRGYIFAIYRVARSVLMIREIFALIIFIMDQKYELLDNVQRYVIKQWRKLDVLNNSSYG